MKLTDPIKDIKDTFSHLVKLLTSGLQIAITNNDSQVIGVTDKVAAI